MKIVSIFAPNLYAFKFENEVDNELRRLLLDWNDVSYLYRFLDQNKGDVTKTIPLPTLIDQLIENANSIDDKLGEISNDTSKKLEDFFKHLNNQEYRIVQLSKQKGRKNYLRLYAIRIDSNCFVITGGAIKFHHLNKDKEHTRLEMDKIEKCKDFLKNNSVFDSDSFFEFLNDQ